MKRLILILCILLLTPSLTATNEIIATRKIVEVSRGTEVNREDQYLLARLIYTEARGESFKGQVAVGAVAVNRSTLYNKSIQEVIYAKDQFAKVGNKTDESCLEAAKSALEGMDNTDGAIYFWNPQKIKSDFHNNREVTKIIGNHVFYL